MQVFIQQHGAAQPQLPQLARAPPRTKTTCMAYHCAWDKWPATTQA